MKTKSTTKQLSIKATPEDLDELRAVFGEMSCDKSSEGHHIAKKMMRAVHRCRKLHGFKWTC